MAFSIDFDNGESYWSSGPTVEMGPGMGYGSLESYRIDGDGMVVLNLGGNKVRKIPVRRLLRITEA